MVEEHIHIVVEMPTADGRFEQARNTLKLEPVLAAIADAMVNAGLQYRISHQEAPAAKGKKPRAPRSDAGKPRAKKANGEAAESVV